MKRNSLVAITVAVSLCASANAKHSQQTLPKTRIIPDAHWVKIYFESIDRLAARMQLPPLRSLPVRGDDVEMRIWEGFGIGPLTGYVVKRSAGKWFALAARQRPNGGSPQSLPVPPSTNWGATWERLQQAGIAAIPDDSERQSCALVLDGVGYVVEIAQVDSYRTYLVSNPQSQRSEDGDRFLKLLPGLYEAFGEAPWLDVTKLPKGEVQTVGTVLAQRPATVAAQLEPWVSTSGKVVERVAEIQLSPGDAVSSSTALRTPTCAELPAMARKIGFSNDLGDVAVELLIEPTGSVLAARALSGWTGLRQSSVVAALRWKFAPMATGNQLRGTTLTIRYREHWVDFPWLKSSRTP